MPKIWNLQPKIIFFKPDWMPPGAKLKYDQKYLKNRVKVMGLGQWGKKYEIVVGCLAWLQIKAVDSLNHLKLFTNQNCLTKWGYLLIGSILGSERSNGSQRTQVCRGCRRTLWVPPPPPPPHTHTHTGLSEINLFYSFYCSFGWNILPEANHRQHSKNSHFKYGHHEKMPKNGKWEFPKILTITDK